MLGAHEKGLGSPRGPAPAGATCRVEFAVRSCDGAPRSR
jgi:hypothetical protein